MLGRFRFKETFTWLKVISLWLNKHSRLLEMSSRLVLIFLKCNESYKNIWFIPLRRTSLWKIVFLSQNWCTTSQSCGYFRNVQFKLICSKEMIILQVHFQYDFNDVTFKWTLIHNNISYLVIVALLQGTMSEDRRFQQWHNHADKIFNLLYRVKKN